MTINREIVRVDFVKQVDGTTSLCVGLIETAPDPFNAGERLVRAVEPNPMTPEMAEEKFGLSVDAIIAEINLALNADNTQLRGVNAQLEAAAQTLREENALLLNQLQSSSPVDG